MLGLASGTGPSMLPLFSSVVLCRNPRFQPGDPAGHVPLVLEIGVAEPSLEAALLRERDVDNIDRGGDDKPPKQGRGGEERCLAEQYGQHAADHRIAHESIDTAHDQLLGRVPWCEGALAKAGEEPDGLHNESEAKHDEGRANHHQAETKWEPERRCRLLRAKDHGRHDCGDRARKDRHCADLPPTQAFHKKRLMVDRCLTSQGKSAGATWLLAVSPKLVAPSRDGHHALRSRAMRMIASLAPIKTDVPHSRVLIGLG